MNSCGKMIKARFKNCSKENKQKLSQSKCVLPISVGQYYHEKEYLNATINLINKHFKECTIMVCDTLQRHTIQMLEKCSKQQAYKLAFDNGDQWIKRNQKTYEQLTIPYHIMRWDGWLHATEYKKQRTLTNNLYKTDSSFQDVANETIINFLTRKNFPNNKNNLAYCLEHILEECSVMPLWTTKNFSFELYPSHRSKPLILAHKFFVEPHFQDLLIWIRINFKKLKTM